MTVFKNVTGQKLQIFAFDASTSLAKTGDAANITCYVSKDYGAVTVLGDTSATELSATNAPGWYGFDLTQAETNADALLFTGKSVTANIQIVGQPTFTVPPLFTTLAVSAAGLVTANVTQMLGAAVPPRYTGTALSGGAATIGLAAGTTALQACPGDIVLITGGTGAGQSGIILSLAGAGGATPVATMIDNWASTIPNGTSTYEIIKIGGAVPAQPPDFWANLTAPARTLTAATNITTTGASIPITAGALVASDAQSMNSAPIQGTGTLGDLWRGV